MRDEKDVPTVEAVEEQGSRFLEAQEHEVGARRDSKAPQERQEAAYPMKNDAPLRLERRAPSIPVCGGTQLIRRREEFQQAVKSGARYAGEAMVLYLRRTGAGVRFGVGVSSRLGGAVERNRAKRVMREIFRRGRKNIAEGCDIVVFPKAKLLCNSFDCNEMEFSNLLCRARCLR